MIKKIFSWQVFLGVVLVALSALVYYIHYLVFHDLHHILIYLVGDIAFVFFEVLLVTLVIHQLLHYREKKAMLNKLNMVIGAFFSEVGNGLLRRFIAFDDDAENLAKHLKINNEWPDKKFVRIRNAMKHHDYTLNSERGDLQELRDFLSEKRQFLLGLLENPNLLEHDSFTDLLWAVFHLTEELVCRQTLASRPASDTKHLSGDMKRAYCHLILEWLDYMHHLKRSYPYLFSLAIRTNPFDSDATVEVVE